VARATDEQRVSLATLRTLQVPLPGGRTVPLSQFATFGYDQEYPLVWRRDRVPTLTVQADVVQGALPETVVGALAPAVDALARSLPRPYRIAVGGTVEESRKSQASVIAVVPVMLLIMFTVLMFQLQSFQRLFLVLSVAPLGLIGVVGALLLSGKPLGFVAILGILALIGIITKNAVDPDRPDRIREGAGQRHPAGCHRRQQRPLPPDHADGDIDGARYDPDRPDGVLGPHGIRHHGRTAGRDRAHAGVPADPVRRVVQLEGAGVRRACPGLLRTKAVTCARGGKPAEPCRPRPSLPQVGVTPNVRAPRSSA
jgi:AcrB/AcrD/AcrF family